MKVRKLCQRSRAVARIEGVTPGPALRTSPYDLPPGLVGVQAVAPRRELIPAGHGEQALLPGAAEKVPALQKVEDVASGPVAYDPAGARAHTLLPCFDKKVPGGQGVATVLPLPGAYEPAGANVHTVFPEPALNVPG